MAVRTGHIYSRSRDRVMSRGPRAVPPAWREQQRDRITSESRVFRSYETRVSSDALPAGMKYVMEDSAGYVMHFCNLAAKRWRGCLQLRLDQGHYFRGESSSWYYK